MTPNWEHLEWIYSRLISVHKENPNTDYMLRLNEIVIEMKNNEPKEPVTLRELERRLANVERLAMMGFNAAYPQGHGR